MKKARNIWIVCICLAVLLSGCAKRTDVKEDDSHIYGLNPDRTGLVKISYDISEKDPVKAAGEVLEEMKKTADDIEYTAAIPADVTVQDMALHGSILELDFSSEYRKMDALDEKLVRAAVVQSLVKISGINAVSFSVDGEPLKDSDGKTVGLMNADDFVENTGSSPSTYQTDILTLYFANKAGDKLVKEEVSVKYSSNVSKEKLIVERIMQGPKNDGRYPTINPDTNLLSVTIKDEICYVNFDSAFLTGTYDILPELTVYSVVNSLVEGTGASKVQITINGETKEKYMENVDISKPLEADASLVAAGEK